MEWLQKYYPALLIIGNAIFWLIAWALQKTYAKRESVNSLDKRLIVIEKTIEDMPNKTDFHGLELLLKELATKLDDIPHTKDISDLKADFKELRGESSERKILLNRLSIQIDQLVENELKGV